MNVYQKLNQARDKFHQAKLKKSGHNKFAGYSYFELGDFVVPALQIFNECGLTSVIRFGMDQAVMEIVNTDKPDEKIIMTSPMSSAALKGCHEVQNLGAVQTYLRRYLWVAALEIVEHDALDASKPVEDHAKAAEKAIQTMRHSPVPDVVLDASEQQAVNQCFTDIVLAMDEGREMEAIDIYYGVSSSDEKLALWKLLAPHSKIRSLLKANKPQPATA